MGECWGDKILLNPCFLIHLAFYQLTSPLYHTSILIIMKSNKQFWFAEIFSVNFCGSCKTLTVHFKRGLVILHYTGLLKSQQNPPNQLTSLHRSVNTQIGEHGGEGALMRFSPWGYSHLRLQNFNYFCLLFVVLYPGMFLVKYVTIMCMLVKC